MLNAYARLKFVFLSCFLYLLSASSLSYAGVVPDSPENINPILVGQKVPALTLTDVNGNGFELRKAFAEKPTLLIFYRGSWCPYCNTHLAELRKIESELISMGIQIIAVSPDLPEFLKQTIEKNELKYQLLSDSKMLAAKALGLAYRVDDETNTMLKGYTIDLEKNSGEKHQLLPVPAALLVDTDSTLAFSFIAPDYKIRVDNGVVIAAAKALLKRDK